MKYKQLRVIREEIEQEAKQYKSPRYVEHQLGIGKGHMIKKMKEIKETEK